MNFYVLRFYKLVIAYSPLLNEFMGIIHDAFEGYQSFKKNKDLVEIKQS